MSIGRHRKRKIHERDKKEKKRKESTREGNEHTRAGQLDVTFVKLKYIYFLLRSFAYVDDDDNEDTIE